jgi:hypothetical protein
MAVTMTPSVQQIGHGGQSSVHFLSWARPCFPLQNIQAGLGPNQSVLAVVSMRLEVDHSPPPVVKVISEWNYTSAVRMPLWCSQEQLYMLM